MAPSFVAPAYTSLPDLDVTLGDEAAEIAAACSIGLDPEQKLALDAIFAIDDGRWATFESVVVGPRQNIKTHVKKVAALTEIIVVETPLVMWSAHEFDTALASQEDLIEIIEDTPWLNRRCTAIRTGNNRPGIQFDDKRWIRFKARTKTGARGLTAPCLFLDEAFALTPAHIGSLMPTMSALSEVGNPHIVYGSSAGMVQSDVLRGLRDRGRNADPTLAYLEWAADQDQDACESEGCTHTYGTAGCVLDDEDRWAQANLALGRRISVEFVRMERRSMDAAEFARERLGWWDEPVVGVVSIPAEVWKRCRNPKAEVPDPVAVSFDVDPGQMSASVLVCSKALHVREHRTGTAWVVDELRSILETHDVGAVGLDGTSAAARSLIPELEKPVGEGGCGLTVQSKRHPNGKIVAFDGPAMLEACEAFWRDLVEEKLVHRGEHHLDAAVAIAGRRLVGKSGWRWARMSDTGAISPLNAATIAWRLRSEVAEPTTPFAIVT